MSKNETLQEIIREITVMETHFEGALEDFESTLPREGEATPEALTKEQWGRLMYLRGKCDGIQSFYEVLRDFPE